MDGVRYSETWDAPGNIPNIADLALTGTSLPRMYVGPISTTIPGHDGIFTGRYEDIPNDGSQSPYFPSFAQEYLYTKGIKSNPADGFTDRAKFIFSKDKLFCMGNNTMPGPYQDYRPYVNAGVNGDGTGGYRSDALTHALFKTECLGVNPPEISAVSYASPDTMAHASDWGGYILAIQAIDAYVGEIVSLVNAHPLMRGNTNIVVTTDHGRETDPNWKDHGGSTDSERHAFFVANGPDITQNLIGEDYHLSIDISPSFMFMLGYTKEYTDGVLLNDMLIGDDFFTELFRTVYTTERRSTHVGTDQIGSEEVVISTTKLNDINHTTLTFTPDGNGSYLACRDSVTDYLTNPSGSIELLLGDDAFQQINFPHAMIPLFGTKYSSMFVGSNGYITFGGGDTESAESFEHHFNKPRISGLFNLMHPAFAGGGGTILFKELVDRVVVTFDKLANLGTSTGEIPAINSFQIEIFFDGIIRLTYLDIGCNGGLIGLSRGNGVPLNFVESDFSTYANVPPAPTSMQAGSISPYSVELSWLDNSYQEMLFRVERQKIGSPDFTLINSVLSGESVCLRGQRTVRYTDHNLSPDTTYFYRVFAVSKPASPSQSACPSYPSNIATVKTRFIPSPTPPPPPMPSNIHNIRQDEKDQLQIGVRLSMRQASYRWNSLVGSEWYVYNVIEGSPRKIIVRPVDPRQANQEWIASESQIREFFSFTLDIPGPPPFMQHI